MLIMPYKQLGLIHTSILSSNKENIGILAEQLKHNSQTMSVIIYANLIARQTAVETLQPDILCS